MDKAYKDAREMNSSYAANDYGALFKAIVELEKPLWMVEFGILEGYSTYWFLQGLKANGKGRLESYDLFEDYPYNHSRYGVICQRFQREIQDAVLSVEKGDYWQMPNHFPDGAIGVMHIDISNDGETFEFFVDHYLGKLAPGGLAILEGGGRDRDGVEWMTKYNKRPIRPVLEALDSGVHFVVFEPYPSITLVRNRG